MIITHKVFQVWKQICETSVLRYPEDVHLVCVAELGLPFKVAIIPKILLCDLYF